MPMSVTDERHARELSEAYAFDGTGYEPVSQIMDAFLAGFQAAHERLSVELEDLRAKYNDRGKVMYDAGDVVRSLYIPQIDQLKDRIKGYEAALEYYADKYEWREHWFRVGRAWEPIDFTKPPEQFLGWQVASEALARGQGEK